MASPKGFGGMVIHTTIMRDDHFSHRNALTSRKTFHENFIAPLHFPDTLPV
jgi:hypothetical protein